ncbi:SRPBCC family protein [Lapillicoccus sp.]|uniref:SRPBCC family protein n=1 Tax=Lapillicoccus sp. TaxID=1909287 RepID=UPI0032652C28
MMGSVVETDWQPGSPITWSGEWKGKPYQDKGEIVAVDEPDRLELTHYSPLTGQDDVPESYHTLVYTLEDRDGGTQVSVTQDNNADQDEADRNSQAWTQMLDGLKQTVEGS